MSSATAVAARRRRFHSPVSATASSLRPGPRSDPESSSLPMAGEGSSGPLALGAVVRVSRDQHASPPRPGMSATPGFPPLTRSSMPTEIR